ncbi:MAG: energy transducer TonB, partial [Terriglobales bacterium]
MPELNTLPVKADLDPEPQLDLLLHNQTLEEPIWKSLFRNIDEFFFPKKLPPLVLTSKPVPVRDIWGFYDNKGKGAVGSTAVHIVALALIIIGTIVAQRAVKEIVKPKETVELIAPSDMPTLQPSRTVSGGGGGGGDRDKIQATRGRLPRQAMEQFTPPVV